MASTIVFNGTSYSIPAEGDSGWGTDVSNYLIAISTNVLQRSGGSFVLTSEVDFGNSFGVKLPYIKSVATNPSGTGIVRLGNNESIGWRNAANNADLLLTTNASNVLQFNSQSFIFSGLGSIVNADVSASAAIAYSKLNLSGTILNADISSSAAIARSKLAALTASRAMVTDGSGNDSVSTVTATELGYLSGATSAIQTQINTKLTNPMTTGGDVVYGGASGAPTRLANGSAGQFLKSNGGTSAPSWSNPTIQLLAPSVQRLTSGSGTYGLSYYFIVNSANSTAGATYTNNTQTFTVTNTISSGTLLLCTSTGAPASSGTLTKASGTGDATITFTSYQAPLYLAVSMVGGGGGGGGSGTAGGTAGGAGGNTTLGSSYLIASGGSGGARDGVAPSGGSVTVPSGVFLISSVVGATGQGASKIIASSQANISGASGGASWFGGAGGGGDYSLGTGKDAAVNSGSGGGGAGSGNVAGSSTGASGAAGGFIRAIISSPSATYSYAVGAGGSSGTAGTSGTTGGAGGSGLIAIEEYFQ